MTPNLFSCNPTLFSCSLILLFSSPTLLSSTPKVFFYTPTLLSSSPKILFCNPDLHSCSPTLLSSTPLINYATRRDIETNYNYRNNKTQLYTTNGQPLTHAYAHLAADVQLGGSSPACVSSHHDSESSRKPPNAHSLGR